jgi:dUTPase
MSQLIENLPEDMRQLIEKLPEDMRQLIEKLPEEDKPDVIRQLIEQLPKEDKPDVPLIYDISSTANYTIRPSEHVYIPYTCTFEMPPDKIKSIVHQIASIPDIIVTFTTVEEGVGNVTTLYIHNTTVSEYHIKEGDLIGQLIIPASDSTGQ